MKRVTIKVDGSELEVEEGITILEALKQNGIELPTFCHDDRISKTTSCFVCMVKETGRGKFIPSCASKVYDGLEIEAQTDELIAMRKTCLELLLSEHSGDCEAPCKTACPAHADVEAYVRAGKNGDFKQAIQIITERIPLPMSIGRVCPRFCEKDCRRNLYEEAVAINDFKRLSADLQFENRSENLKPLNGKRIAVVGAGPAGFAAAYYLRKEGISVKLYDREKDPGGMLRYGIPEYRLPKKILDRELGYYLNMDGIDFEGGQTLGENLSLDILQSGYDAVIITIGCWKSSGLRGVLGAELADGGIEWLKNISAYGKTFDPGKTVVIGGGNTAMDCVRTAVRLANTEGTGADITCLYRRGEKEMPAEDFEIEEAKEEGVKFSFLTSPVKIELKDGKKCITLIKMELGEPDASGRRRPVPIKGSEYCVTADTVIAAVGQKTSAPGGLPLTDYGDINVHEKTLNVSGSIFAAGDCVSGAATVVEAVAGGRRAALSVLLYLENGGVYDSPSFDVKPGWERIVREVYHKRFNVSRGHWQSLTPSELPVLNPVSPASRQKQKHISLDRRQTTFDETTLTMTPQEICDEGHRCLECSCVSNHDCKLKDYGEMYEASPEYYQGEKSRVIFDNRHPVIFRDMGKCIKCGKCVKICKEVIRKNIFEFYYRGYETRVGTALESALPDSCSQCMECVYQCPVGALGIRQKKQ